MIIIKMKHKISAFNAVGGYEKLVERYASSAPNVTIQKYPGSNDSEYCNQVPEKFMHLIRPPNSDLPWTGVIFGLSISHIWYFCTDQVSKGFYHIHKRSAVKFHTTNTNLISRFSIFYIGYRSTRACSQKYCTCKRGMCLAGVLQVATIVDNGNSWYGIQSTFSE